MEINIGNERIMALHARYSAEQIRGKAMAKRIEAFGMIAKLIQRVQPEDIKIATFQKRFEPDCRQPASKFPLKQGIFP